MLKHSASDSIYDVFDVVRLPFPFSDLPLKKRRPALVISSHTGFGNESGCAVVAMITTGDNSLFPLDMPITHWREAGLLKACKLRMKLFTIEHALIDKKLGCLRPRDRRNAAAALRKLIPLLKKL